ncbi:hydrogenase [bacterium]|nr:MAG: hydrogenase [bacterium]
MKQSLPVSFIELLFEKLDPDRFQARFLKALMNIQNVERGSIWIKKGNKYVCSEAFGDQADKVKGLSIGTAEKSIVGSVIESGRMTVAEPGKDQRHFKKVEESLNVKSTLILCFPLTLKDGKVYGAVQILDTSADGNHLNLDPDFLDLLQSMVTIGGIALSTSLEIAQQQEQNVKLQDILEKIRSSPPIIGQSDPFLTAKHTAEVYAASDYPVMITGESGTGKELIAREIHRLSVRAEKPFLAQNCSAIPDTLLESELFGYKKGAFTGADQDKVGLFEAAGGGVVFLDEIGDMPLSLQAKILGVLQNSEIKPLGTTESRSVDFRIISATNKDLNRDIASGQFREDLFYRLNVLPLELPSLRKRKEDIPLLLNHFLERFSLISGTPSAALSPETLEQLVNYPWPGNIREMENLTKYLLTVSHDRKIELSDLPPPYSSLSVGESIASSFQEKRGQEKVSDGDGSIPISDYSWEELEREYVTSLLEKKKWNIAAAARHAGLKRTTFSSRMKKLGISKS